MEFDGVNESINHGNDSTLNFDSTDAFSLSVWFKLNAINKNMRLADKSDAGSIGRGYSFFIRSSNKIAFGLTNNSGTGNQIAVDGSTVLTLDSVWHNFTVTYDGSQTAVGVNLYLDGVLEIPSILTDGLTATTQTPTDFNFGIRISGSSLPLDGLLNSGGVYDKELNATEVMEISSLPLVSLATHSASANLILYNKMGDGANFDQTVPGKWWFPDDSGSGLPGTSVNMEEADRKTDTP